jgi:hypothetical protein
MGQLIGLRLSAYPLATQRAEHPEGPQQKRDQHDKDHDRDDVMPDTADHKSHAPIVTRGVSYEPGAPRNTGSGSRIVAGPVRRWIAWPRDSLAWSDRRRCPLRYRVLARLVLLVGCDDLRICSLCHRRGGSSGGLLEDRWWPGGLTAPNHRFGTPSRQDRQKTWRSLPRHLANKPTKSPRTRAPTSAATRTDPKPARFAGFIKIQITAHMDPTINPHRNGWA